AGDQVRRQQQRVGTRLGRLAVDLDREVAGRATVLQRRRLHRLRGARRGRLDVLRAGFDLHRGEVACLAEGGVADRAVTLADRGDHAGGAVGGLTALDRPDLVSRVAPGALAGLLEVVGEVIRGAGLVGAVNRRDRGRGQLGALVLGGDRRVVPLGDLAVEDLGDRLRGELQVLDPLHVVEDRDRAHVVGDLDGVGTAALLGRVDLALVGVQRRVAGGEVDAARVELLDAGT